MVVSLLRRGSSTGSISSANIIWFGSHSKVYYEHRLAMNSKECWQPAQSIILNKQRVHFVHVLCPNSLTDNHNSTPNELVTGADIQCRALYSFHETECWFFEDGQV